MKEVRRLKTNRDGEKCDSLSVMIKFEGDRLPSKVYLGYMSYQVRPYIPPPLRCFKCQKHGHVAAVCRGKQRCGRCAGEHEYGKCGEGAKLKCCNCGGEHSSAYRGCEFSKRATEIQRVKVTQGITYAEAAKKVSVKPGDSTLKPINVERDAARQCGRCDEIKDDTLIVGRNEFLLFIVDAINCSAQTGKRTEKIKIIVRSAEKYLGIKGLGWEEVEERLGRGAPISKSQAAEGGSSWT